MGGDKEQQHVGKKDDVGEVEDVIDDLEDVADEDGPAEAIDEDGSAA